jgi:prepilin-type N-terminal cleavage/methylation domain-containing protein
MLIVTPTMPRPARARAGAARAGFSLLELLVVVAMLVVIATGAVLAWWQVGAGLQLDAGLQQLAADLHAAHDLAIDSAASVRLVFRVGSGGYRRERAGDDGTYRFDADYFLPPGIAVADVNSGGVLAFSARGQAENGSIVLVDGRGVRRTLRLNQRGRITVLPAGT